MLTRGVLLLVDGQWAWEAIAFVQRRLQVSERPGHVERRGSQPLLPKEHAPALFRFCPRTQSESLVDRQGGGVFFEDFERQLAAVQFSRLSSSTAPSRPAPTPRRRYPSITCRSCTLTSGRAANVENPRKTNRDPNRAIGVESKKHQRRWVGTQRRNQSRPHVVRKVPPVAHRITGVCSYHLHDMSLMAGIVEVGLDDGGGRHGDFCARGLVSGHWESIILVVCEKATRWHALRHNGRGEPPPASTTPIA